MIIKTHQIVFIVFVVSALVVFFTFFLSVTPEPFYQGRPINYWLKTISDDAPRVRSQAEEVLVQALSDTDPFNRCLAAEALIRHHSHIDEVLLALDGLRYNNDARIRRSVAGSLTFFRHHRPHHHKAISILVDLLSDENNDVRKTALLSLYGWDSSNREIREIFPPLIDNLKGNDYEVSQISAFVIVSLNPEADMIVPDLVEVLKDSRLEIRLLAVWILGRLGPKAEAAIPALTDAQIDEDESFRQEVAKTLSLIKKGRKRGVVHPENGIRGQCGDK